MTDIDKIMEAGEKLAAKLAEVAAQVGPQVQDLALTSVRVSGAASLMEGLAFALVLLALFRYGWTRALRAHAEQDYADIDGSMAVAACVVATVGLGICVIGLLGDLWNWVAVFRPELYVAHKLLGL